jgi:hypothetical protein
MEMIKQKYIYIYIIEKSVWFVIFFIVKNPGIDNFNNEIFKILMEE